MIRNEAEYQEATRRLREERSRLADHQARFEQMGLGPAEVKRALDPLRAFHEQLVEEVDSYERLKRGDIAEIMNLHGLGHALVALRIPAALFFVVLLAIHREDAAPLALYAAAFTVPYALLLVRGS